MNCVHALFMFKLDKTNKHITYIMIFSLHTEPAGLALDIVNRRLYYSDTKKSEIFYTHMDLDGPATAIPGTKIPDLKSRQLAYSRQAK